LQQHSVTKNWLQYNTEQFLPFESTIPFFIFLSMSGTWLEYGVYGFFHVQESWKHSPLMPGHESYTSS
jgi:hypothetical protein